VDGFYVNRYPDYVRGHPPDFYKLGQLSHLDEYKQTAQVWPTGYEEASVVDGGSHLLSSGIMQGGVNGLKCITMELLRGIGPRTGGLRRRVRRRRCSLRMPAAASGA
jgi:hypothetical protein